MAQIHLFEWRNGPRGLRSEFQMLRRSGFESMKILADIGAMAPQSDARHIALSAICERKSSKIDRLGQTSVKRQTKWEARSPGTGASRRGQDMVRGSISRHGGIVDSERSPLAGRRPAPDSGQCLDAGQDLAQDLAAQDLAQGSASRPGMARQQF
jgi:hypothetical protein